MKDKLWNRDFTLMFAGNIISVLGSVGLNVALGVIIYDKTQSTLLSSIFVAIITIPNLVLPMIVGSVVDRKDPLRFLLKNEKILLIVYSMIFIYKIRFDFNFLVYLFAFSLVSSLGVISEISGQSITAQLMSPKVMSKGYAIMSTIYPLSNVIVAPVALVIYKQYGLGVIIFTYMLLSLIDMCSKVTFDMTLYTITQVVPHLKKQ